MKEISLHTTYKLYDNLDQLNTEDQRLLQEATNAIVGSHAPYSGFHVGAALLLNDQQIILGSNQENASYPLGLCAERTALSAAASLAPNTPIKAIAIMVKKGKELLPQPVAPCGICRQVLLESEFKFNNNIRILLGSGNGIVYEFKSIKDMLPLHFDNSDL